MAKATKNKPAEGEGPAFGVTGYGVTLTQEGQPDIEGNFITDEDLAEYQHLKTEKEAGYLLSAEEIEMMKGRENTVFELRTQIAEFEKLKQTGQFISNDEAAHYHTLKKNADYDQEMYLQKQEAETKAASEVMEAARQAQLKQFGENPVDAVNVDGRTMTWPRNAWDNLAWQQKNGKDTNVKTGGWMIKADVPDEIKNFRNEQNTATQ